MTIDGEMLKHELRRFALAHIELHGKTRETERYIEESLMLWREAYGVEVERFVRRAVAPVLRWAQ